MISIFGFVWQIEETAADRRTPVRNGVPTFARVKLLDISVETLGHFPAGLMTTITILLEHWLWLRFNICKCDTTRYFWCETTVKRQPFSFHYCYRVSTFVGLKPLDVFLMRCWDTLMVTKQDEMLETVCFQLCVRQQNHVGKTWSFSFTN